MADAAPEQEPKKARRYPSILVRMPGFPSQDPGRQMLYTVRPTEGMAKKMMNRLARKMPEYEWTVDMLTAAQTRAIKHAPFRLSGVFAVDVEVKFTGRGYKVVPVA